MEKNFKQSGHLTDPDVEARKIVTGKPNKLNVRKWAAIICLEAGHSCGGLTNMVRRHPTPSSSKLCIVRYKTQPI